MMELLALGSSSYAMLFVLCAVSGLAIPVPEDVPLLYAGMRLEEGQGALGPTLAVAVSGVFVRDLLAYGVGRCVGAWLLERPWVERLISRRRIERACRLVEARGSAAVLVGRFLIGMRAPVFLVAGAMGVSMRKFVLWDLLGLMVAVPAAITLGYLFGAPLADALVWTVARSRILALTVAFGGAGWLWWRSRAQRRMVAVRDES
jgi:membrane protein DedA with SNARE-associated domain